MQLIKITSDGLTDTCSQRSFQSADAYIGDFYACEQHDNAISGKIRGNHGEYDVMLTAQDDKIIDYKCVCETAKTEVCKHIVALGLTYIEKPWLFNGTRITKDEICSKDDLKFYIATTPLKELVLELKNRNISLAELSSILNISMLQLSGIIKDDVVGKQHQLTEPLKLACLYMLDKNFTEK